MYVCMSASNNASRQLLHFSVLTVIQSGSGVFVLPEGDPYRLGEAVPDVVDGNGNEDDGRVADEIGHQKLEGKVNGKPHQVFRDLKDEGVRPVLPAVLGKENVGEEGDGLARPPVVHGVKERLVDRQGGGHGERRR
mmetsp:Transcript_5652/g.13044  ORF Transcript_5652/g.13044 Transcript_5652/m.13044 type:complete len:136 (+) Transcript_5652:1548-1955(+)